MADGFLGYRASLMLDVVVCALVVLVPLLGVQSVPGEGAEGLHTAPQSAVAAGAVLFVAVRPVRGRHEAARGDRRDPQQARNPADVGATGLVQLDALHHALVFAAATTPVLWVATIAHGFWYFDTPPVPGPASRRHKLLGWASAVDITLTSDHRLAVYYFGFVV